MNEDDRKVYKPAPSAGQIKCPKCGGTMVVSAKNPSVSVCTGCGSAIRRVKMG